VHLETKHVGEIYQRTVDV